MRAASSHDSSLECTAAFVMITLMLFIHYRSAQGTLHPERSSFCWYPTHSAGNCRHRIKRDPAGLVHGFRHRFCIWITKLTLKCGELETIFEQAEEHLQSGTSTDEKSKGKIDWKEIGNASRVQFWTEHFFRIFYSLRTKGFLLWKA